MATPAASKFDSTVDASHDDQKNREGGDQDQKFHVLVILESGKAQLYSGSVEEQEEEDAEDDDRGELKVDTSDHDVGANLGVPRWSRIEGDSSRTSTNSLNDEGDDIDSTEDPEIPSRSDGADSRSGNCDHAAQDDIDSGGEEGRCCANVSIKPKQSMISECIPMIKVQICIRKAFALYGHSFDQDRAAQPSTSAARTD